MATHDALLDFNLRTNHLISADPESYQPYRPIEGAYAMSNELSDKDGFRIVETSSIPNKPVMISGLTRCRSCWVACGFTHHQFSEAGGSWFD